MGRNKYDVDESLETGFNIEHLKRLGRYMLPYKKKIISAILLMMLSSCISLIGPILVKKAIDDLIPNNNILGLSLIHI